MGFCAETCLEAGVGGRNGAKTKLAGLEQGHECTCNSKNIYLRRFSVYKVRCPCGSTNYKPLAKWMPACHLISAQLCMSFFSTCFFSFSLPPLHPPSLSPSLLSLSVSLVDLKLRVRSDFTLTPLGSLGLRLCTALLTVVLPVNGRSQGQFYLIFFLSHRN